MDIALPRLRLPALACLALAVSSIAVAEEATPPRGVEQIEQERQERQRQLDSLAGEMRLSEEQLRQIQAQIEAIKRDREELTRQLVETAQTAQAAEARVSAGDTRLQQSAAEEARLREALAQRRAVIAELLAALQRLGRNPPPAVVVEPESALKAVRSAILLGAVLPELRGEAEKVLADLTRLDEVRTRITAEVADQRRQLASLGEARARLELLAEQKKRTQAASEADLEKNRARVEQLVRESRSLTELVARLEQDETAARRAAEQANRAEAERQEALRQADEQRQIDAVRNANEPDRRTVAALPNPGRLTPAIAFEHARGLLPMPASGDTLRRYGEEDGLGGTAKGLFVGTRPGAVVTSPADGSVVYAGPFRSYGQIVLVNAGSGYHILLAGMERITVEPGQFVLAGEPVAQMGARLLATATAIDIGSDRPVLYVEFRKDGATIDPGPWWAETAEKAHG